MKTTICLVLSLLLVTSTVFSAENTTPNFLKIGHSYEFIYALDSKTVNESHLPDLVIVISHAGGSWYLVKPVDRDVQYWINLTNVAGVTELAK